MNSNETTSKLRFTGERLIPGETDPDLFNEHFARYVYARMFCSGKIVLDTGCGVGYGSLYLAECARSVVGVDNDAAAVEYARSRYRSGNTAYVVGDCQSLPFLPESFQVITSFELIEHLPDAKAYLAEVRRVLEPKGLFLVSTPNRPVYAEHRGSKPNPFHVREWDFDEFVALLRSYFKFVEVLGETHLPSVGILSSGKGKPVRASIESAPLPAAADYFVCICSQESQNVEQIVFTSSSANVLRLRERHIKALQIEVDEFRSHISALRAEFDEKGRWANKLNSEVSEQRRTIVRLQEELRIVTFLWNKATRWKRRFVLSALALLNFVLGLTLIGTEITGRLLRKLRRYPAPYEGLKNITSCSIIIPSWDGKELLAESLPPLIRAVELHGGEHEIIVVDNGSTDGTSEYVAEHFPEVRVVRSDRNLFFSGGSNLGVQAAKNDIVVLLNNDMVVHEDFLAPLLSSFTAPDVFAVGSQVFPADSGKPREETGKTHATFNGCDFDWSHEPINRGDVERKYVPVFWGHGGAAAMDRGKFLWLGGFDPHFDPFYVEDADLSYRAWKVGWRCLLAVESQVVHKHRGTIGPRFSPAFINQIIRRNEYLFIWKNLGSLRMLVSHFLRSPIRAMQRAGVPQAGIRMETTAFLGAAKRLFPILISKVRLCLSATRTDDEILRLTNTPPMESIFESDLDFSQNDFSEHLGAGWYPREQINGQSFRWTSKDASVFLRAPGETAELCVRGYVTGSRRHGRTRFVLSVECEGERKRFNLEEGPFEQQWLLPKLQPGAYVPVQLSVNSVLTSPAERRILGVIVHRVALLPPVSSRSAGHVRVSPPVSLNRNVSSTSPRACEQRQVLMVCAYLPCLGVHSGGNTMFHLIRSLSKRHRLSVLSFCEQESELEHIEQLTPYCERLEVIRRCQTLDALNPFGLMPPEIVYEFYHKDMYRLVEKYIRAYDFDLIQCEFLQMAHYANVAPHIPAVLSTHEVQSLAYFNRYRGLSGASRPKFKAMVSWMRMLNYEEKMLRRFSGVVVLTRPERDFLQQYAPQVRVYDHPTGVDSDFFCCGPEKPEEGGVVFVGNFRHAPNVTGIGWFLKEAWPKIRERYTGARLCIVGANPPSVLQEINGQNGVTITGWVDDVRPFLQQAAVFVAPIFDGVGLRGKVLEAWAAERPVVGTRLAFEGLTSNNGTICFMADDADTFATRTCELLENQELATKMGKKAREAVVASFSWDAFGDFYDSVYRQILGMKTKSAVLEAPVEVGVEQH